MDAADRLLLTGAGFTHNFGAPLADHMWSLILGHPTISKSPRIRDLLLHDFDYEGVYHTVTSGSEYAAEEQAAIKEAVIAVYESLDDALRRWLFAPDAPNPVNIYGVWKFLAGFKGARGRPGYVFTLNQDLFIERHYTPDYPARPALALLGLGRGAQLQSTRGRPLQNADRITLPASVPSLDVELRESEFFYIKLHGSTNWVASDGSHRMVIGRGKARQISEEPLLAAYLQIFESALSSGGKRLLIAGYGFRDEHINAAIAKAVESAGLEVYILSPQPASVLKETIYATSDGSTIWKGLCGYFPYTLLDLFPADQSDTIGWAHLCQSFGAERG